MWCVSGAALAFGAWDIRTQDDTVEIGDRMRGPRRSSFVAKIVVRLRRIHPDQPRFRSQTDR